MVIQKQKTQGLLDIIFSEVREIRDNGIIFSYTYEKGLCEERVVNSEQECRDVKHESTD